MIWPRLESNHSSNVRLRLIIVNTTIVWTTSYVINGEHRIVGAILVIARDAMDWVH